MSNIRITAITVLPPAGYSQLAAGGTDTTRRQNLSSGGNTLPPPGLENTAEVTATANNRERAGPVENKNTDLQFRLSDITHRPVITVRDAETGDPIRQIPFKEQMAIAEYIAENSSRSSSGSVVDESE